jgi:hypothetical protein
MYIENNESGEFVLIHILKYANLHTSTVFQNPTMNLFWRVENKDVPTNINLKAGSGALFVEGDIQYLGVKHGIDNSKTAITTLTNIFTIKNADTYNTVKNRAQIRMRSVSLAYDVGNTNSGVATLLIILNATLNGTPRFTTIDGTTADEGDTITNGQSIASVDIAGDSRSGTGGTVLYNSTVAKNQSNTIDLTRLDIFISPGETLTFACKATTAGLISVAGNWVEDI